MTKSRRRKIRICYWDAEQKFLGPAKLQLETHLQKLYEIELVELRNLNDPKFHPCDLLVTTAESVPEEHFPQWLNQLQQRIEAQNKVWTPALILSHISFAALQEIQSLTAESNWYFDVLQIEHIASLPIRVANLLRIHDHLHELKRYDTQLRNLSTQVEDMKKQLNSLTK